MPRHHLTIAAVLVFSSLWVTNAMALDGSWRVKKEQAECLLSNVEVYLAVGETPTVIFLDDCPKYDPVGSLEKLAKNSLLPTPAPATAVDNVIVFTPSEMRCLKDQKIDRSAEIVLIPKRPTC